MVTWHNSYALYLFIAWPFEEAWLRNPKETAVRSSLG